MSYRPTPKQAEATRLIGSGSTHVMLFGGSRSGKTFEACRIIAIRALAAPGSRHAILRFRFNHVKTSIIADTWPKMMATCFPGVPYELDRTDWYAEFPNGSQVWFGGLDDKERTEKILGQEYVTIFLNESSQIPWNSRNIAVTRLAQKVTYQRDGQDFVMRRKMLYDENPPSMAHWTYLLFVRKVDPDTKRTVAEPSDYASMQLNPADNVDNLPPDYLKTLAALPARMRTRFLDGKFGDTADGALWTVEMLDKWRAGGAIPLPDMQRVIVAVDPSGSDDEDNAANDDIGIVVVGLGTDGNGYVLEDLTCKTGPKGWATIAVAAYDRHDADGIVAEVNYGGAMVKHTIQSVRRNIPIRTVTASRGKVVRAEPIASLTEQGKVRFAGSFPELEDELCSFTTNGYRGAGSPNRADAMVWGLSALFPGIAKEQKERPEHKPVYREVSSWMS